ncbi:MAG: MFS transporter [Actinobacteria bacterium]|nr:MFS transporter [Actinomycetota bacterium]MBW3650491.1 MFS transporter [Actinomycetota bacterium]
MRVLKVPGFAALLAGQAVNAIGNWVALIAIWGFAAFRFDAGAGDLALLFVVMSVPGALLGPLLGVPIDRLGPRRTLILANALGFLDAIALTQAGSYEAIIVLALPLGLIEALATASLDALPPRLVAGEDLVTANALLGGAQDVAIVVGPVVAAVVNARWGLAGAFGADAVTFLFGLAVALPLTVGPVSDAAAQSTWRALREGLDLARRVDGVRWTLGVALVTYLLWALFGVLEPLYVRDVLGESDTVFALLQTVFGIGLVGAGLALAALGERMARPRYVAVATVVSGATAALYLGTKWLPVAFVGVFLWGIDVAFFYVPAKTLLQRYTPTAAHGRILSLNQSLEPLAAMAMAPVAAAGAALVGVQVAGVAGGAMVAVVGVIALRLARRLGPLPPPRPLDPTSGSSRDAIALGGSAPG